MRRKRNSMVWVPLMGNITPTGDGLRYKPSKAQNLPAGQKPVALAKSDSTFSAGTISLSVKINSSEDRLQVVLNHPYESQLFVGLNCAGAAYGILLYKNGQWEPLSTIGTSDMLVPNRDYNIRIVVVGSLITLFIDGAEVCRAAYIVQRAQPGVLISSSKPLSVRNFSILAQKPMAFIVMQFTDEYNALYEEVIRPVCTEFGYTCVRADDIYNNGLIIEDITRSIRDASVVIADITPSNPNVFYELGYSHGLNKPTILLSDKKREKLPFDVSGFRTLFYDNTIGGKTVVEERLRNHLKQLGG